MASYDKIYNARNRLYIENIKSRQKCIVCQESDPICLDFHHLVPADKILDICKTANRYWALTKIAAEVKKCVLICNNCHRKLHAGKISLDPKLVQEQQLSINQSCIDAQLGL